MSNLLGDLDLWTPGHFHLSVLDMSLLRVSRLEEEKPPRTISPHLMRFRLVVYFINAGPVEVTPSLGLWIEKAIIVFP